METASAAAIVVTERTGHLSSSIKRAMQGRAAVTIVAQSEGELSSAFAERVARKVAKQDLRQRLSTAVLSCGAQNDATHWRTRARIASSLLSAIDEGGELVISTRHDAARHSLTRFLDLVDALQRHGSPSARCVRLRFDADPRNEGDRRSEPAFAMTAPWRLTA